MPPAFSSLCLVPWGCSWLKQGCTQLGDRVPKGMVPLSPTIARASQAEESLGRASGCWRERRALGGRSWYPPVSSLQVPDLVLLRSATGTLRVGHLLTVPAESMWEHGMNMPGKCPPFPLAGEDAHSEKPRESCLLLLPLPSLEPVPGCHGQTPTLLLSLKSRVEIFWMHTDAPAELSYLLLPTPLPLWAPTPAPHHRPMDP